MKDSNIYIEGSVAFSNYISETERKYGVYFNISGKHDDTFYELKPYYREGLFDNIPHHYDINHTTLPQKNVINFEEFVDNYMHDFEQQLTHTSINHESYSII